MDNKKIQIEQLEKRIKLFSIAKQLPNPPTGWIRAVRLALGMSMQQLANRLMITKQSVREIEIREMEESITLRSLRDTANALDMELVYGFVPRDGSLQGYIRRKARKMAESIVRRTSNTMKLEDQENSTSRIERAIEERTKNIIKELPKSLWD
jgi:predicted DNA-binding mobile mystery protein A